mmetsp:Transcript_27957/g.80785  ORF Transcript_27957/g.80785 Transcript_27957/m.80785 type:complete len:324 (-) Transcript_27957:199-1170(-)
MTFVWRSSSTSASCAVLFLRLVSLLTLPDLRIVDSFAVVRWTATRHNCQPPSYEGGLEAALARTRRAALDDNFLGEDCDYSGREVEHTRNCTGIGRFASRDLAQTTTATTAANQDRRRCIADMLVALGTTFGSLCSPQTANAAAAIAASKPIKSRSEGYEVRHTKAEWTSMLSGAQCNVLRRGGTERQRSSILENEKRPGLYVCAGCQRPLFTSAAKFSSGTGWPSFDAPVDANAVEVESIGTFQAAVDGAEVRCQTCGGHLGDVFGDGGWRYGTKTGKRYCINGAALVFRPEGEGESEVRGDIPPPNKVIQYEQVLRREPVV